MFEVENFLNFSVPLLSHTQANDVHGDSYKPPTNSLGLFLPLEDCGMPLTNPGHFPPPATRNERKAKDVPQSVGE